MNTPFRRKRFDAKHRGDVLPVAKSHPLPRFACIRFAPPFASEGESKALRSD